MVPSILGNPPMHAVTEGSGTDGGDGHTSARRVARSFWKISGFRV